jgi:hypothetical protein
MKNCFLNQVKIQLSQPNLTKQIKNNPSRAIIIKNNNKQINNRKTQVKQIKIKDP